MKRRTAFLFLLFAVGPATLTACSETPVAPVPDPLIGVWARTEAIRLPSLTDDHTASSGEQRVRWVFAATTWQYAQTVTSADSTSALAPRPDPLLKRPLATERLDRGAAAPVGSSIAPGRDVVGPAS